MIYRTALKHKEKRFYWNATCLVAYPDVSGRTLRFGEGDDTSYKISG